MRDLDEIVPVTFNWGCLKLQGRGTRMQAHIREENTTLLPSFARP